MTQLLREMAWTGVIYGLLIIAFAELIGDHRWAVATRRKIAGATDSTASVVGVALAVVVLLLWWSPGHAFDRWITGLTLLALAVGGVVALIVIGRRELPDAGVVEAQPSDVGDAATS